MLGFYDIYFYLLLFLVLVGILSCIALNFKLLASKTTHGKNLGMLFWVYMGRRSRARWKAKQQVQGGDPQNIIVSKALRAHLTKDL